MKHKRYNMLSLEKALAVFQRADGYSKRVCDRDSGSRQRDAKTIKIGGGRMNLLKAGIMLGACLLAALNDARAATQPNGDLWTLPHRRQLRAPLKLYGIVEVTVAADGWVKDAKILQGSGYPRLDKACLDAFAGGRFIPATENGVPVEKTISFPVVWRLAY
jgi:TonB family protein